MSEITELERQFASEIAERRHGDDCTASDLANRLMPFLAEVRRQAAEEALLKAADAFEGGEINIEIFGDSVEASLWRMSNQKRASLVKSLRARAAAYRREETE